MSENNGQVRLVVKWNQQMSAEERRVVLRHLFGEFPDLDACTRRTFQELHVSMRLTIRGIWAYLRSEFEGVRLRKNSSAAYPV